VRDVESIRRSPFSGGTRKEDTGVKETIIKMELPLRRLAKVKKGREFAYASFRWRWFSWLFTWGGGSVSNFDGHTNHTRYLHLFRWHVLTVNCNEYHDRSDKERADEYLKKWSECEKELRGLRLLLMGDSCNAEVKKVIRESFGINLDEGTIL
jgi:hypothetical protein